MTEVTFYPEGGSTGGRLLFAQAEQSGIIDIDPFTGRVSTRDPKKNCDEKTTASDTVDSLSWK